jgi:hypothetical protein
MYVDIQECSYYQSAYRSGAMEALRTVVAVVAAAAAVITMGITAFNLVNRLASQSPSDPQRIVLNIDDRSGQPVQAEDPGDTLSSISNDWRLATEEGVVVDLPSGSATEQRPPTRKAFEQRRVGSATEGFSARLPVERKRNGRIYEGSRPVKVDTAESIVTRAINYERSINSKWELNQSLGNSSDDRLIKRMNCEQILIAMDFIEKYKVELRAYCSGNPVLEGVLRVLSLRREVERQLRDLR